MPRVRVFIDFWNFQLNWRDRMKEQRVDWSAMPGALLAEANRILQQTGGATEPATLEETLVYASVNPERDKRLKGWLENSLDRLPSFRVNVAERRERPKKVHCRKCDTQIELCASCGEKYTALVEKGVDTAIVTDLLSLAWQDAYNVAILVSGDADFIPATHYLQERGLKVINAAWAHHGHHLAKSCWASFDLDNVAGNFVQ